MESPNVLFIIADQLRADHLGFMGNGVINTPHVDQLAAQGLVFDNAWVSNPVCMPNRSTIMTGRMPSAHGCIFNDRSLDWNVNTWVRQFKQAGYATGLIGKSHLQHGMSQNSVVPHRGEPSAASAFPPGWDQLEDYEPYLQPKVQDPADFYGFNQVEFAIDHGARVSGHHLRWALEQGGKLEELLVPLDATSPATNRSQHWWQIYKPVYDAALHSTSFVTERTKAFIEQAHNSKKPWVAYCSYPDPHHPMTPPGEWFHRHKPQDVPLPNSRHDPLTRAPAHLQRIRKLHPKDQRDFVTPTGYGDDALLAEAIAATFGMIEMIDDGVGQLMAYLTALGVSENTIVIFTSDHGDMMGDHGLLLKGFMHYRGTLQVPYVIRMPNTPGARTSALASSIDFAPTLLDLCGLRAYDGIQGQSLVPVLKDTNAKVRDWVLVEDDLPIITSTLAKLPARTRSLVTERHRYTRNSLGEEQLFDLSSDPDEMTDLVRSQPDVRVAMLEQLTQALMMADDSSRGAPATEPMA